MVDAAISRVRLRDLACPAARSGVSGPLPCPHRPRGGRRAHVRCAPSPEWPVHAPARATSWHQSSRRGDDMCRWLAYSGSPLLIADLLYKPQHSLIDQSLHSKLGAETTNGDGFGIGWYGVGEAPGVFYSVEPAWNDRNLREITEHIESSLVFAHIRASTGTPVQQTNCHPFRHGRWLW